MAKNNNTGMIILAVVVIGGLLVGTGTIDLSNFGIGGGQTQSIFSSQQPSSSSTAFCGDDGQADLEFRYRNVLNTTQPDYHSATGSQTLSLVNADTGKRETTLTHNNADGSFESSSNELICGNRYYIAIVDDANEVAVKSATFTADKSSVQIEVEGARSSQVNFNLYSTSFGNQTNAGANAQDFTTVDNTALGVGGTLDLRYDVASADASAQFGAIDRLCESSTGVCGKAFVCVTGATSVYQESDLTITGSKVISRTATLPRLCQLSTPSNAGVGLAAFEIDSIKNSEGRLDGTLSITAGLSDPADTNNVRFIWMDNSYYQGSDNTIKVGTADDTGTDNGETNNYFEANIQ